MKIYVVRHGQIVYDKCYDNNPMFPSGDIPLTDLGRTQARLTGEKLKDMGFNGIIYSSPYNRTLGTADIIAEVTGSKVYPLPFIQEIIMTTDEKAPLFKGLTLKTIKERYKNVADDAVLEHPWWIMHHETMDDVDLRVTEGLKNFDYKGDTLFVGHGASCYSLKTALKVKRINDNFFFNCGITCIEKDNPDVPLLHNDFSHLPLEAVTNNPQTYEQYMAKKNETK